jgi:hypothetical protein
LCKLYSRSVAPFLNDKVKNVVWFIRSLQTNIVWLTNWIMA